jgi:hypothetical protein
MFESGIAFGAVAMTVATLAAIGAITVIGWFAQAAWKGKV